MVRVRVRVAIMVMVSVRFMIHFVVGLSFRVLVNIRIRG